MTHGMRYTRFYGIYTGIRSRCGRFKYYKHVKCCWRRFEDFKRDMYRSYTSHIKKYGKDQTSIERIDNSKGYSKSNCKWATRKEQADNTSRNFLIKYKGKIKTLDEWSKILKIKRLTLRYRLKSNWPIKLSFETPVSSSNRLKKIL